MNIEQFRTYCITKNRVEETFPFDADTLVFKIGGKMFALISLSNPNSVNLKCEPEKAVELRATYHAISPGFHMNKMHWNTVHFNQDAPDKLILELVDHSYNLVFKKLTKKQQTDLLYG